MSHKDIALTIIDTENRDVTFRVKNLSEESMFFFEPIQIQKQFELPANNHGSLWINESSENKAYNECILENEYSVSVTKQETKSIITLTFYNGLELKADENLDIKITLTKPGNYQLVIVYDGLKNQSKSIWGLNKSQQIISEKFTI